MCTSILYYCVSILLCVCAEIGEIKNKNKIKAHIPLLYSRVCAGEANTLFLVNDFNKVYNTSVALIIIIILHVARRDVSEFFYVDRKVKRIFFLCFVFIATYLTDIKIRYRCLPRLTNCITCVMLCSMQKILYFYHSFCVQDTKTPETLKYNIINVIIL